MQKLFVEVKFVRDATSCPIVIAQMLNIQLVDGLTQHLPDSLLQFPPSLSTLRGFR